MGSKMVYIALAAICVASFPDKALLHKTKSVNIKGLEKEYTAIRDWNKILCFNCKLRSRRFAQEAESQKRFYNESQGNITHEVLNSNETLGRIAPNENREGMVNQNKTTTDEGYSQTTTRYSQNKEGRKKPFPPDPETKAESEVENDSESEISPEDSSEGQPEVHGENEPEPEVVSDAEGEPWSEGEAEGEGEGEPEAEVGSVAEMSLFVTAFSLCIVFIVVGNIMVAVAIAKTPELRKSTSNLFLLSLITARASIGFLVVPARITGMFSEAYLGSVLCRLCHFAALGSSAASVFSIVAIAIAKFLQVAHHKRAEDMSTRSSALIIILIWVLGFLYAIRAAIVNDLIVITSQSGMRMWSCTNIPSFNNLSKYFLIVDFICLFAIPAAVVIVCYSSVIRHLAIAADNKKMQSMKAIQMLITLMILFIICTLAPMLLQMYVLWGGGVFDGLPRTEASILLFSYSNSWFNVVVFLIFREDLRAAFASVFCKRQSKRVESMEIVKEAVSIGQTSGEIPTETKEEDINNRFMMEF